jgi:hypothetical protein
LTLKGYALIPGKTACLTSECAQRMPSALMIKTGKLPLFYPDFPRYLNQNIAEIFHPGVKHG